MASLADRLLSGDRRAVARAISLVEDADPSPLMTSLFPHGGRARVVGLTGAPGSGKSTLADRLVAIARRRGDEVAVLAVDPSSPFTGGAVLGDRVRMQDHISDPGVYVRSMSTRGALGGLAQATGAATVVLDAAGFDLVIVETVGVGQSEVDVIELVETTVVVVAPGFGDGIQAAKAGLLEIGDIFVVNKADLDGADSVIRDLRQMLSFGAVRPWSPPVVASNAVRGDGVEALWHAIGSHQAFLDSPDGLPASTGRIERMIRRALVERVARTMNASVIPADLVAAVAGRRLDPWSAAARIGQAD